MTSASADARHFDVTLPDGRTLHAQEAGDVSGQLVVYHHGTPGSGVLAGPWAANAMATGIRLVGYDRAGYGGSTRHEGRRVADVASDIAALADSLGADRFFTWGASGGGPHTLACAALLGERVIAAATVASAAPYDAPGLDFLAGMGQDNIDEFGAAMEGSDTLTPLLAAARGGLLSGSGTSVHDLLDNLLPDVDRRALTGDMAEYLFDSMAEAVRHGVDGWLDDDLAFVVPWGFDVTSIDVPLLIMQGEQDLMVPFAHGRWLASQLPAATVELSADEGHLSLLAKVPEIHAWLTSQA